MTITRRLSLGLALFGATLIGCASSQAANTTLYDNTSNTDPAHNRFKINKNVELGDEVLLDLTRVQPEERKVGSFAFEYYGLNFTGSEKVRVRFYAIDTATFTPSTTLWDSGNVTLPAAPDSAVMRFTDFVTGAVTPLTGFIPSDLLWTVEFSGFAVPQTEAGLDIYTMGPGDVGNNLTSYWQKFSGGWSMLQALDEGQSPITVDFGAQFTAVPEPSTLALGLLGLIGLAGAALKRRVSRQ